MTKEKSSSCAGLNSLASDYRLFNGCKILFRKYCEMSVSATKKFQVNPHIETGKY